MRMRDYTDAKLTSVFAMFHDKLLRELNNKSRNRIDLDTMPRIARVLERFGYVETSVIKDGYVPGYDKVFMEYVINENE